MRSRPKRSRLPPVALDAILSKGAMLRPRGENVRLPLRVFPSSVEDVRPGFESGELTLYGLRGGKIRKISPKMSSRSVRRWYRLKVATLMRQKKSVELYLEKKPVQLERGGYSSISRIRADATKAAYFFMKKGELSEIHEALALRQVEADSLELFPSATKRKTLLESVERFRMERDSYSNLASVFQEVLYDLDKYEDFNRTRKEFSKKSREWHAMELAAKKSKKTRTANAYHARWVNDHLQECFARLHMLQHEMRILRISELRMVNRTPAVITRDINFTKAAIRVLRNE